MGYKRKIIKLKYNIISLNIKCFVRLVIFEILKSICYSFNVYMFLKIIY